MSNVENERTISLKFLNATIFNDLRLLDNLTSSTLKLSPLIPKMKGFEIIFKFDRKEKELFWQSKQVINKLIKVLPENSCDYSDSRQKNAPNNDSFLSSSKEYHELFGDQEINEAEIYSIMSSMTEANTEHNKEANMEALGDLILSNHVPKPIPIDEKLFSIKIPDFLRFQATFAMLKDERDGNQTYFPGLDKKYLVKLIFTFGDKYRKIDGEVTAYGDKNAVNIESLKFLIQDYIKCITYEKLTIKMLENINTFDFIIERVQSIEPSVRYIRDLQGNWLIASLLKKRSFIEILKRISEMKIFKEVVMKAEVYWKENLCIEEKYNFFKIKFVEESNEINMRFRLLAKNHQVERFQMNKCKKPKSQELMLYYESNDSNSKIFRAEYEKILNKIKEICIENVPNKIFHFVKGKLDFMKNQMEDEGILMRMYYSDHNIKEKVAAVRSIVLLGEEAAYDKIEEIAENIRNLISAYSQEIYSEIGPDIFTWFENKLTSFQKSAMSKEFLEFYIEPDPANFQFYTYGIKANHERFHQEIKKFIDERLLLNLTFDFKENLILAEFKKEILEKSRIFNSSSIQLPGGLIYIDPIKVFEKKSKLSFECYRRDSMEIMKFLKETCKEYKERFKCEKYNIIKEVFTYLQGKRTNELEHKHMIEVSLENPMRMNVNGKFISRFTLKQYTISLYEGVFKTFTSKAINLFPISSKTAEILSNSFPMLKKSVICDFLEEFKKNQESRKISHFYHIFDRNKKDKKSLRFHKNRRIFLYPLQNMQDPDNYIDFFEGHNIQTGVRKIFKSLNKEKKPCEEANIFLYNGYSENDNEFLKEIIELIRSFESMSSKITLINLYHPSQDLMINLSTLLTQNEVFYRKLQNTLNNSYDWYYIPENLKGDWQRYELSIMQQIELTYRRFRENPKKAQFLKLEKAYTPIPSKAIEVEIDIDIVNQKVFIEKAKKLMFLKTFAKEIDDHEFAYIFDNNQSILTDYKDAAIEYCKIYAYINEDDNYNLKKLRNNTIISCFDFLENKHIIKNCNNITLRSELMKRSPGLKKKKISLQSPNKPPLPLTQSHGLASPGECMDIWLNGFDSNIKSAKTELEAISARLIKESLVQNPSLPLTWDPFPKLTDESRLLVEVKLDSLIWQKIKQNIENTLKKPIIYKIERVQNKNLYEKYQAEAKILLAKRENDCGINARHFFYGSAVNPIDIIFNKTEAFDPRLEPSEALLFSQDADIAFKNSFKNEGICKEIIYAEVLVGKCFELEWDIKNKLAPKDGDERYDSVLEGKKLRIFEANKAYPEYLITFNVD